MAVNEHHAAQPGLRSDRNFLMFWAGQALSQFGVQLGAIAMPVLAVALLSATEWDLGVLNASQYLAFLLLGLPAGAWVDHWRKRQVMIWADLLRVACMFSIPVLWYLDVLAIWHLWVIAAIVGCATVFFDVGYQSYIPSLVRREQISEANAKLEGLGQVSRLAGPAAGGALLHVVSAPLLFLGQGLGFLISVICIWATKDHEPAPQPRKRHLLAEISEGLGYVVRHRLIGSITWATMIMNFFSTLIFTLLPILVLDRLSLNATQFGLMYSFGAVGGLAAASVTPWIARVLGEGPSLVVSSLAIAVPMAGFPLSTRASTGGGSFAILAATMFLMTAGVLVFNIIQVSMRQRVCPPRLLGRMNASIRFLVWGVMPGAALFAGWLGTSLGLVPTFWIGMVGCTLAVVPLLLSPLPRLRVLPNESEEIAESEGGQQIPADEERAGAQAPE
ncbi:MFS transporter [Paeniglutamicibacter cryotolerans]|uniref:MFS family permease n=1 Tax=Paeniglutamicibacter cryotolerans TaxID=670079 RepID=A0A839QJW8_9MICC|nr:MFS transporter [Paeniglutamicibacter cryotolerans]MBB2993813.1 MFS family permease [Paeniglutamicibacter cryotolerans]MBB2996499.1 MFS family permease [Paeniglutamicibacter cryotolerans]